jgi:hypothetical protein
MAVTEPLDLEAERSRLALDAEERLPGAAKALADVEKRLRAAELEKERAGLVDKERERRREQHEQQAAEEAVAAHRHRLGELASERLGLATEIEELADSIAEQVSRYCAVQDDMFVEGAAAGIHLPWQKTEHLESFIIWRLIDALPRHPSVMERPIVDSFRRSFVEQERSIVGGLVPGPVEDQERPAAIPVESKTAVEDEAHSIEGEEA